MRCPACDALNGESAGWCTQCYASLRAPEPPPAAIPETATSDDVAAALDAVNEAHSSPSAGTGTPVQVVRRGNATYRKTAEGLDWQCGLCESFNPLQVQRCSTCGHSFADTVRGPEEVQVPDVDENLALLVSAVLPGAGHFLAGRVATAIGRATMYLVFLLGGWLLLREASSSGQSILPAVPMLLGALVIWVATGIDSVYAARGEDRQLLEGRTFFWLVIIVLGSLMATFAAAALSVGAS